MSADSSIFHAFTLKANGIIREIISDVGVSVPFVTAGGVVNDKDVTIHRTKGLWDTGATGSCVTVSTAKTLGLIPTGKVISNHAQGQSTVNTYLVNLYLPNNLVIPNVRVTECADTNSFGVIIGMDVITNGDLSITNVGGKTVVSFRMPSIKMLDYVQEANDTRAKVFAKVGRNDLCPCGSGKKFKHCHGQ
jgi:SEC-C motif/Aspartyl protease